MEEKKNNIPKKKKNPVIIILVIILIILAIVIGVTSILLLTHKETEEKENKATHTTKTTKEIVTIPVDNTIKFYKENIALQPTSININTEYANIKAVSIAFNIINNTGTTIMPAFHNLTINGKAIENTYVIVDVTAKNEDDIYGIAPYSESGAVLYLDKTDYDRAGIKEIENITLTFTITDEASWKKTPIIENEPMTITKEEVTISTFEGYKEKTFINQNGIKVSAVRVSANDVRFFVENNTANKIEIDSFDIYINEDYQEAFRDTNKYKFWNITLDPYKREYSQLFVTEDYLYTSSTIKHLRAKYIVYIIDENNNKKELFTTKELDANFE